MSAITKKSFIRYASIGYLTTGSVMSVAGLAVGDKTYRTTSAAALAAGAVGTKIGGPVAGAAAMLGINAVQLWHAYRLVSQ